MPRFLFQARDGHGELATGVIAANDLETAGRLIRAEGRYVVKLRQVADEEETPAFTLQEHAKRVRRHDVIFFTHQLAVMLETGVPIGEALDCVIEQAGNPHFKEIVRGVADHVQAGGELSIALKKFPRVFPNIMVSLVKASEISGTMGTMLDRISCYLDKEERTRRQARGALMYPLFMMATAIGVTVFLMTFVMPRFAKIYAARQAVLPAPTRLLLGISASLVDYWSLWIAGAVVVGLIWYVILHSDGGRRFIDWLKLNVPIIRHLYGKYYLSRACRTLATMLNAGVAVLDAIDIARQVTDNVYYHQLWDHVSDALRQGLQLSDPLLESRLIPRAVVQMVRSGEKSGRLGQVLTRLADYTEIEFDDAVRNTTQFIEPAMVILMGSVVGFVAISLLLPIFNISRVVAGG